jgi:hypothetical protein
MRSTDVWITPIGGYPGKYNPQIKNELENNLQLFILVIHILKVVFDKKITFAHELWGFKSHQRTMLRFVT